MEIIDVPRCFGKTNYLIHKSKETGYPIVVGTKSQKELLCEKAKDINIEIPEPITITEFLNYGYFREEKKPDNILIDELPNVLSNILGCNVKIATMTSYSKEYYDMNF